MAYREKPSDDLDDTINETVFAPIKASSPTQSTSTNIIRPAALLLNTTIPPPSIRVNTNNVLEHTNDDDDDAAFALDLDDVINQISNLRTSTSPASTPVPFPLPKKKYNEPTYLSSQEQFLKQQNDDVKKAKQTVKLLTSVSELMARQAEQNKDKDFIVLARNLLAESKTYKDEGTQLELGIQKAQKVVKHYNQSIPTPTFYDSRHDINIQFRDIISLTGYFDPSKNGSEFRHVWMKLYDYGQSQKFAADHYTQALSAILKGEAYEAFVELREKQSSLEDILKYLTTIYGSKRSITADRTALENFYRKRNEPIKNCFERCKLVIDKLRYTYPEASWTEMRVFLIKQTLLQLILPETKNYVVTKENHILETTGFHLPLDQLITTINTFESINSKIPSHDLSLNTKHIPTGKQLDPDLLMTQVANLKQVENKSLQLEQENNFLKDLISANYTRSYKNDDKTESSKEKRKTTFERNRSASRDRALQKNRQISPEPVKPPVTPVYKDYQSQYQRPKSPFTKSYSNNTSRTEENQTPKFESRTDKPFVFTASQENYPEKKRYSSPPPDRYSPKSDYRSRYDNSHRSSSRSNYDRYRQSSQPRSSTPYRSSQRSPSYSRDYNKDYSGHSNNYRSRDHYRSNSNYKNRSKSYSSDNSREPNTEKLTFSNEDKSIYLTMVEKPHQKN